MITNVILSKLQVFQFSVVELNIITSVKPFCNVSSLTKKPPLSVISGSMNNYVNDNDNQNNMRIKK